MEKAVNHLVPTALLKPRISVASMHFPLGRKDDTNSSNDIEKGNSSNDIEKGKVF